MPRSWNETTLFVKLTYLVIGLGVLHNVQSVCVSPIDVVFVVDSSSSIRRALLPGDRKPDDWDLLLQFVSGLVQHLRVSPDNTRVGLVKFSYVGTSVFYLDSFTNSADIKYIIERIGYIGGSTNTSGGIWRMRTDQFTAAHGDRNFASNVGVIITDGESTWDRTRTIPEAEAARQNGIGIIVIGVSEAVNEDEIRLMSSVPHRRDEDYFLLASFQLLNSITDEIFNAICKHGEAGSTTDDSFQASAATTNSHTCEEMTRERHGLTGLAPFAVIGSLFVCCVPHFIICKKKQRDKRVSDIESTAVYNQTGS